MFFGGEIYVGPKQFGHFALRSDTGKECKHVPRHEAGIIGQGVKEKVLDDRWRYHFDAVVDDLGKFDLGDGIFL